MYYYYEAQLLAEDISLKLDAAYSNSALIFTLLFGVVAFALCLFTAISIKRARPYGIIVALAQPVGLFAAFQIVMCYSKIDFSSLNGITGSTQDEVINKVAEKLLGEIFPQLALYMIWTAVLTVVFILTLVYCILLFKARAKGLAIFAMITVLLKHIFIAPIEFVTLLIGQNSQAIQVTWDFVFRFIYLFPLLLIAIQGLVNLIKNSKEKKLAAARVAAYSPMQAPMYQAPAYAPAQTPAYAPAQAPAQAPAYAPAQTPAYAPAQAPAEPQAQPVESAPTVENATAPKNDAE